MCSLEGLADEEARQDAGDGRHEDDEPEVRGRGQHIVKQVVDVAAPLQRQGPVHDEVHDPEGCTACRLSLCRPRTARIGSMPQWHDALVAWGWWAGFSGSVLMHLLSRQMAYRALLKAVELLIMLRQTSLPALHQMQTWWIQVQYSNTEAISRCTVNTTMVNRMLPTCTACPSI